MPAAALLALATRQANGFLRSHYSVEEVSEWDPVWFTIINGLVAGQRLSGPAYPESDEIE